MKLKLHHINLCTVDVGWQQIFFYDPDGNVIEVHQVPD